MKRRGTCVLTFCAAALLVTPLAAETGAARGSARTVDPNAWGLASATSHTIHAATFQPFSPDDLTGWSSGQGRYQIGAGSSGFWHGPVALPTGVEISRVEVQGCDKSAENLEFSLLRSGIDPDLDDETLDLVSFATSSGDTDCDWWGVNLPTPHIVDSYNYAYMIQLRDPAKDGTLVFQAVRIFYRRLVSPAPGLARFDDVPTSHPLFQYVEALAESGITAGCDANNFCPNSPLTRGQMAVFLAKALGLHWPL